MRFPVGSMVTIVNWARGTRSNTVQLKDDHHYRLFNHPFLEVLEETDEYLRVRNPITYQKKSLYKWRFVSSSSAPTWEI